MNRSAESAAEYSGFTEYEREGGKMGLEIDWLEAAMALLALIFGIMILTGKGASILKTLGAKDSPAVKKREKTKEEKKAYERTLAIFLFVLAGLETISALFSNTYLWVNFLTIGGIAIALVVLCVYLKRKKLL